MNRSAAWVWVMGHDRLRRHVTLWHNIIAASQLPSSLLVILSNNNSINSVYNWSTESWDEDVMPPDDATDS